MGLPGLMRGSAFSAVYTSIYLSAGPLGGHLARKAAFAVCSIAVLLIGRSILPPNGRILSDLWAPVASQQAAICSVFCHMLHVQPNAAHRQPNAPPQMSHISPYATLWQTKQHHMQRFLQYAAYAALLQPNAPHRQPNPHLSRQISGPRQPCGQPASSHMHSNVILQYSCI